MSEVDESYANLAAIYIPKRGKKFNGMEKLISRTKKPKQTRRGSVPGWGPCEIRDSCILSVSGCHGDPVK